MKLNIWSGTILTFLSSLYGYVQLIAIARGSLIPKNKWNAKGMENWWKLSSEVFRNVNISRQKYDLSFEQFTTVTDHYWTSLMILLKQLIKNSCMLIPSIKSFSLKHYRNGVLINNAPSLLRLFSHNQTLKNLIELRISILGPHLFNIYTSHCL